MKKPLVFNLALATLALLPLTAHADLIKQGVGYTRTILITSSSDHITGATGLTLTIKAAKAGGTPATITDTVTEQGSGRYAIALTATDTNTLGALDLIITATGADPSDTHDQVVAFDPNDASLLGLTGVATATTQTAQGTALGTINTQATGANTQATTLLLSLATYQSVLTAGSTTSVLNTALTGTADLTGSKVVFTTGINKGVTRTITSMNSTTGAITLLTATPSTPGATDAFSVVQGSKALEQFLAALGTDSRPVLSANAQPAIGITNALPALDGSNRVLLQPVQTGVTIPTVTALTNTVVAASVTAPVTLATGEYANIAAQTSTYANDGPPAGTALALTITHNGTNQPVLTWNAAPSGSGYKVFRSTDGATYSVIATPSFGTLTYTDTARPTGATVYYHIAVTP